MGVLADLVPGSVAVVSQVSGADAVADRLSHLGFLPGTRVRVMRRAPLGDPTVFELRGNQMCLRRAEASRIQVGAVA
jgi:ferrous iron transport protein A